MMEERVLRRRTRYFLLSFLAHLFVVLMVFLSKYEHSAKKNMPLMAIMQQKKQEQKNNAIFFDDPKSELPASLKPRKSTFGTLAHLDDAALSQIPQQHPEFEAGSFDKGEDTPGHALSVLEQAIIKTEETAAAAQGASAPLESSNEPALASKQEISSENGLDKLAEIKAIESQQARFAEISQQLARGDSDISILKKKNSSAAAQATVLEDKSTQPLPKKRKANIIAMTKGFIENLTDEGTDWLKRAGDDSKRPTFEEMKYFSYEQRINWQLQASWKRNFDRGYAAHVPEGKALVKFCIDEQGNVTECMLVQSSGITILDSMILQNVKAAAPFPPLPKHFDTKLYKTGRIIHVTTNRFGL